MGKGFLKLLAELEISVCQKFWRENGVTNQAFRKNHHRGFPMPARVLQPGSIIADLRERPSGIPRGLSLKGLEVRLKNLPAGDYLLSPYVAIERKTTADFIQSIFDKRLFAQIEKLRAGFPHPLLLLERTEAPAREIHPSAYRGALLYVVIHNHIPIVHAENATETVELLWAIHQMLHERGQVPFSMHAKKRAAAMPRTQRYMLETIPGLGPHLAEGLLEKFGSLQRVFAAQPDELMEVAGVGKGRARKIHEILHAEYNAQEPARRSLKP